MSATLLPGISSLVLNIPVPLEADTVIPRDDLIGVKVWSSTSGPGFTVSDTNLVFDGIGLSITIMDLTPGTEYFVKYALISDIEPENYIVSTALSATPTYLDSPLDTTPPPTPTGVVFTPGISNILVEHAVPIYTQGGGHSRSVLFGVKHITGTPLPIFEDSVSILEFAGNATSYATDPATTWRLWLVWVSIAGVASTLPFGGTNGVEAKTGEDVAKLLEALSGEITQDALHSNLGTRIDLIDGADTVEGSVSSRILAEATTRASETGNLFAQYTVKVDVAGHVSGYGLASTTSGATPASQFGIRADQFFVAPPAVSQSTEPTTDLYKGYVWSDTSATPNVTKYYTGSAWSTLPQALPFIVQTSPTTTNGEDVPAGVYMDVAYIKNGTITNAKIADLAVDNAKISNLSVSKLTAGALSVGEYIKSPDYTLGASGWIIQGDGTAEFSSASIRGQLEASQIDTRGLLIRDTEANGGGILFGAGSALDWGNIGGIAKPADGATKNQTYVGTSPPSPYNSGDVWHCTADVYTYRAFGTSGADTAVVDIGKFVDCTFLGASFDIVALPFQFSDAVFSTEFNTITIISKSLNPLTGTKSVYPGPVANNDTVYFTDGYASTLSLANYSLYGTIPTLTPYTTPPANTATILPLTSSTYRANTLYIAKNLAWVSTATTGAPAGTFVGSTAVEDVESKDGAQTKANNAVASVSSGANLCFNADFSSGTTGWTVASDPWNSSFSFQGAGTTWAVNAGIGDGSGTASVHQNNATASGYFEIVSEPIPIEAGKKYCVSAYTGAHRAYVDVFAYWVDAQGNYVGNFGNDVEFNQAEKSGGHALSNYKRHQQLGIAPATATSARVAIRKFGTLAGFGYTDSWLFVARVQFEQVGALATAAGPWSAPGASKGVQSLISSKLDQASAQILNIDTSSAVRAAGIRVGDLAWDANGNRTSGKGLALTPTGLLGHNGTKTTFAINATTGDAYFGGTLTADAVDAVNTVNIANYAVTIPSGVFTVAETYLTGTPSINNRTVEVQSLTYVSSGSKVSVQFSANIRYETPTNPSSRQGLQVSVHRIQNGNDTAIQSWEFYSVGLQPYTSTHIIPLSGAVIDTPAAGNVTYKITIWTSEPYYGYYGFGAKGRGLVCLEIKK